MHVINLMTLVILLLATMRLTRIVVWDKITLPVRRAILQKTGLDSWLSYLVHCVTCTGFWSAALVVGSWALWPTNRVLHAIYIILAVAEVAPRLLNWEPRTNTGGD